MDTEGFSTVSEAVKSDPYPYVYVNDNGSFRDLSEEERQYLEERFHPADGARPYVKFGFYSRTPDGKLRGFLKRNKLPKGLKSGEIASPKHWWRFW